MSEIIGGYNAIRHSKPAPEPEPEPTPEPTPDPEPEPDPDPEPEVQRAASTEGDGWELPEYERTDFDPGKYTVKEVREYLTEHPEHAQVVLERERAGKNRVRILKASEE